MNFSKQSKNWEKGSVWMETLSGYAIRLKRGDHIISFDVKSGYHHVLLAPCMRDCFLFQYDGNLYRCVALPFGRGRSPMCFTRLMAPLLQYMRCELLYRILCYLDDFLIAPARVGEY